MSRWQEGYRFVVLWLWNTVLLRGWSFSPFIKESTEYRVQATTEKKVILRSIIVEKERGRESQEYVSLESTQLVEHQ